MEHAASLHEMAFYEHATFWVAFALFVFVGILLYLKAHKNIASSLDQKSAAIKAQLDEALNLRKEAEKLLAEYQRKQRDAQNVAATIIENAEHAAESLRVQAEKDIQELVVRRERLAREKLEQAEQLAVKKVRNAAITAAVAAAQSVLTESMKGKAGKALVDASIGEIDAKLH